jgi:hypothetical protein
VVSFTPLPLIPGERALGTHWMRSWVGPKSVFMTWRVKILDSTGTRTPTPLCCPACSQSLYRLRYRGSSTDELPYGEAIRQYHTCTWQTARVTALNQRRAHADAVVCRQRHWRDTAATDRTAIPLCITHLCKTDGAGITA